MARIRGSVDHQKTAMLFKAAEAAISRHGMRASLVEIARSAGVSKQTLYNRFGGRSGFFAALATNQASNHPPPVIDNPAQDTPSASLVRYVDELLDYLNRPLHRELPYPRSIETEVAAAAWRHHVLGRARRELTAWFVQQTTTGCLRIADPDAMAALFVQLCVAQTLAPIEISGGSSPSPVKAPVSRIIDAVFIPKA